VEPWFLVPSSRLGSVESPAIGHRTARILRDAQKDLAHQITVAHWDFYRAFRGWMAQVTKVDAFYLGIFHGADPLPVRRRRTGQRPGLDADPAWRRDLTVGRCWRLPRDAGAPQRGDRQAAGRDRRARAGGASRRGARFRSLTRREQEVALLLDLSNAEVAARLRLSERTVKIHVGHILKKYSAKQRAAVIAELRRYLGDRSWLSSA
jgi:DNA-binding CsgD family transcriptional regulator